MNEDRLERMLKSIREQSNENHRNTQSLLKEMHNYHQRWVEGLHQQNAMITQMIERHHQENLVQQKRTNDILERLVKPSDN